MQTGVGSHGHAARSAQGCAVVTEYPYLIATFVTTSGLDQLPGCRENLKRTGYIQALHSGVYENHHLTGG